METLKLCSRHLDKLIRSILQIARLLAFAAALKHGTLVIWGLDVVDGVCNDVPPASTEVVKIYPTFRVFHSLKGWDDCGDPRSPALRWRI